MKPSPSVAKKLSSAQHKSKIRQFKVFIKKCPQMAGMGQLYTVDQYLN